MNGPSQEINSRDAGRSLAEEYLFTRGIRERESRRAKIPRRHIEPPLTEHHAVLSQSVVSFTRMARNSLKLLAGARIGTLPPRMLYRLASLGESYRVRQKSDPVLLAKGTERGELLIIAPKEQRDRLKQVLLVDKRTRVELESGQRRSEGEWSFKIGRWQIPFSARVVLIYGDGMKWQIPLRSLKIRPHI
jgi:hypothetical protein